MRHRYTAKDRARFIRLYKAGNSLNTISTMTGASKKSAFDTIRRAGILRSKSVAVAMACDVKLPESIALRYVSGEPASALAREFGVGIPRVNAFLRSRGVKMRTLRECMREANKSRTAIPFSFSFLPLRPETAWMLGLITGDGSIHRSGIRFTLAVARNDSDIINKIARIVGGTPHLEDRHACIVLNFCSIRLVDELRSLGVYPNKTARLHWPLLPLDLVSHFARGLLDSDGCWTFSRSYEKKYLRFSYSTICKAFANRFDRELVSHVNLAAKNHIYTETPTKANWSTRYAIILSPSDSLKFGHWVYQSSIGIRSERRYKLWNVYAQRAPR